MWWLLSASSVATVSNNGNDFLACALLFMGFTAFLHSYNVTQFYYFQLSDTRATPALATSRKICIASRLCYCRCSFVAFLHRLHAFGAIDVCLFDFLHVSIERGYTPSAMFLDEMRSMSLLLVPFSQIILIEMNEYASQHTHKNTNISTINAVCFYSAIYSWLFPPFA